MYMQKYAHTPAYSTAPTNQYPPLVPFLLHHSNRILSSSTLLTGHKKHSDLENQNKIARMCEFNLKSERHIKNPHLIESTRKSNLTNRCGAIAKSAVA